MKPILLSVLCFLIVSITTIAQPVTQFQQLYGGSANDFAYGYNQKQTSDGGNIIAAASSSTDGTFSGLTNNGGSDGWIFKTDADGNITWQKLYGGSGNDFIYTVIQTNDGGYLAVGAASSSNTGTLTGVTNNGGVDAWVMKLNANGSIAWQKLLGGSGDDNLYGVSQTSDNGYVLTGTTTSSSSGTLTGLNNNGGNDGWIIKLNASGKTLWQHLLGGSGFERLIENDLTTDGGIISVGTEGSPTGSGTFTDITNHGGLDGWMIKFDAAGNSVWETTFGGNSDDQFTSVQQTADGGYITCLAAANVNGSGTFNGMGGYGAYDGWIVKTDATGNLKWQDILGSGGQDFFSSVKETFDGYIVSGQTNSSSGGTLGTLNSNGGYDAWVVKLNKAGNTVWQNFYGGSGDDEIYSIEQTSDNGFFAQGYTLSSNTGTLTGLTNHGGNDAWIIKLEAPQVAVTSYDTMATCASSNTISYKVTQDSAPYKVQLYRYNSAYGSPQTTSKFVTFSNLPIGSYYAIATSKSVTGKSKTLRIIPSPLNPKTSAIQSTQAKFRWDAVPCAAYYSIQFRVQGTDKWKQRETNGNVNSFVLKNLTPSTTYVWEVAAVDSLNGVIATSVYTNTLSFTTTVTAGYSSNDAQDLRSEGISVSGISVSPNPAGSYFIIHYNNSINQKVNAQLYDVNGKAVWSSGLINGSALNCQQVDVSRFAKGTLYLKVIDEKGISAGTAKIIIER